MEKPLRWGILGLGKIAHKFAEDLALSQESTLYAVGSRSADKSHAFAQTFQAEKAYSSYEDLLKDPNVDVVYIATPHTLHKELTIKSLQHGKHVLCEKPLGMNQQDVQEMIQEAQRQNLFLMEGIWTRFIPATKVLLDMIQSGEIGELIHVRADFGFQAQVPLTHRIFDKALGGGSLLDVGLYPVYLSLITFGEPSTIYAQARFTATQVDAACSMFFSYEHGASASLDSSIDNTTPTEAYLYGTKGSIYVHPRFHHADKLTVTIADKQNVFSVPYKGNGYIYEIEEV